MMKQPKHIEINEDLHRKFLYWQDMAKSLEMIDAIEKTWAMQYRLKYLGLRKSGFGRIFSWIATLRTIK